MSFKKGHTFPCFSCGFTLTVKGGVIYKKMCSNCGAVHSNGTTGIEYKGHNSYVPEDMTLLCVGAKGKYRNLTFEIIGRKRMVFEGGYYRNDWYLLFDNDSTQWLYESFCNYTLFPDEFHTLKYDQVRDISVNKNVSFIEKQEYIVETMLKFASHEMEGELPFMKEFDSQYYLIELSDTNDSSASIDLYSKESIFYSFGKRISLKELILSNNRKANGWN